MVFLIPVNEVTDDEDNTSVTVMRVDVGDISMRVAKRKLRKVFSVWKIPTYLQKKMIKELCDEK